MVIFVSLSSEYLPLSVVPKLTLEGKIGADPSIEKVCSFAEVPVTLFPASSSILTVYKPSTRLSVNVSV